MAILRIELLEDCDMNSGRIVNTQFSNDVYFDNIGMPYIPAWIIRNSLVRAAEQTGTCMTPEFLEILAKGHGNLVLDDALIADRESIRRAILGCKYSDYLLRNPQMILEGSGLVKIRETTGIDGKQTVRMLAQGSIFEAYFELEAPYREAFLSAVERTRALFVGHEVRARFTVDEDWKRPDYSSEPAHMDFGAERCRLEYDLHLISRVTALNHLSGELDAESYITGEQIQEALIRRKDLVPVLAESDKSLRFSFAYISVCGHRGIPIPCSYSTKKQDKQDLRDRCSLGRRQDDYDQIKAMGTLYIDDPDSCDLHAMDVREEHGILQCYQNGALQRQSYQAIEPGQTFKGFIEGPAEDIKRITDALNSNGYCRIGDYGNLGFGNALLRITSVTPIQKQEPLLTHEITVLLQTPARLYRNGLYEVSSRRILEEVQQMIGGNLELEIIRNSQKTCCISTYHSAWGEFEPMEYAMQAGSIYRIKEINGNSFDISRVMGKNFIGEHNETGYGEVLILPAVDAYYRKITYETPDEQHFPLEYKTDPNPGKRLLNRLFQRNANVLAGFLGASRAENFTMKEFRLGILKQIQDTVCNDFDVEQVFSAYMDALKEAGLNAIGREYHD